MNTMKPCITLTQVAIFLFCLVVDTDAIYPDVQGFDIFSGEHLDDTIMPTEGGVSNVHAVLAIYETNCVHLLKTHQILPETLPMTKYVYLLWHDYQISNTRTWYDYRGDDLRKRYDASSCLDVVFIPKGSPAGTREVKKWDQEGELSFSDWVWSFMSVTVTVKNHLATKVSIISVQTGTMKGPIAYPSFAVSGGETRTIELYESSLIHVTTEEMDPSTRELTVQLVGVWIINGTTTIEITQDKPVRQYAEVLDMIQKQTLDDDFAALETGWNTMQRHLLNLKQPLVVPKFTQTGYKKIQMPENWFKILRNFYDENTKARKNEQWTFGESIINQNEIQCSMVWLSEEVKETVAEGLRLMMEDWCGMELEMTAFYGVREYYGGNILYNHVDRLDTHVISAIIQIDKDLGGEEDWLLEVIEYGGNRSKVALNPGDMLLYESARLIHGRPKMFKGKLYANVFLHYRPKSGWEGIYHHEKNNFTLLYGDNETETLMPLDSPLTTKFGRAIDMVQVADPHHDVKDEL